MCQPLVEDYIREEILYREAVALGLDKDDTIIRRRLRQKMEFFTQDLAEQVEPTEAELETYLRQHAEDFQVEPRVSFQHVYLNVERRVGAVEEDARTLLVELDGQHEPAEPTALGDPIVLPHDFESLPQSEVSRLFGQKFASNLSQIEPGDWNGPVKSGYGLHLVRVGAQSPARTPELSEVRKAVKRDWQFMRRQELDEEFFGSLRKRYEVKVELPPWVSSESETAEVRQQ